MRVLYDISVLGLAWLYQQSRGGSYRVDLHLCEALAASPACELIFCANHSAVAHHGCDAFLRGHPRLGGVPLLAPRTGAVSSVLRGAASRVHRYARQIVGSHEWPSTLRRIAGVVDRGVHPPVASAAVDVLHTPLPLPPRGGDRPARFLTIFDLAYLRYPDLYGAAYSRPFSAVVRSVQHRDHVVTASRFVRDELLERRVAAPDRIHVVPLAADPALFSPCDDAAMIAAARRRWDPRRALRAQRQQSRSAQERAARDPGVRPRRARIAGDAGVARPDGQCRSGIGSHRGSAGGHPELRGRVVRTGYVADPDLAALYGGARVFVYPTIYEGFGLPPLEAMQCGTPVIALETPSLDDVLGDGALRVPPADLDALAAAMLDLAVDSPHRTALRARGLAQASRLSWDRSAATLLDAYRAALDA